MPVICPHCEREINVPEIAEIDPDAEFPKLPFCCGGCRITELYAMNRMKEEGWVKETRRKVTD